MEEEDESLGVSLTLAFRAELPTQSGDKPAKPPEALLAKDTPSRAVQLSHADLGSLFAAAASSTPRGQALHRRSFLVLGRVLQQITALVKCGDLSAKSSVVGKCVQHVLHLCQFSRFTPACAKCFGHAADLFVALLKVYPEDMSMVEQVLLLLARIDAPRGEEGKGGPVGAWNGLDGVVTISEDVHREVGCVVRLKQLELFKVKEFDDSSDESPLDHEKSEDEDMVKPELGFPSLCADREQVEELDQEEKEQEKQKAFVTRSVLKTHGHVLLSTVLGLTGSMPAQGTDAAKSVLLSPFNVKQRPAETWSLLLCHRVLYIFAKATTGKMPEVLGSLLERVVQLIPEVCAPHKEELLLKELLCPRQVLRCIALVPSAKQLKPSLLAAYCLLWEGQTVMSACSSLAITASLDVVEESFQHAKESGDVLPEGFHHGLIRAFLQVVESPVLNRLVETCRARILSYFHSVVRRDRGRVKLEWETVRMLCESGHEQRNTLLMDLVRMTADLDVELLRYVVGGGRTGDTPVVLCFADVNLVYQILEHRKVNRAGADDWPCRFFERTVEAMCTYNENDSPCLLDKSLLALLVYLCTLMSTTECESMLQTLVQVLRETEASLLSCRIIMLVEAMIRVWTSEQDLSHSLVACLESPYGNEDNMLADAMDVDDDYSVFDLMNDSVADAQVNEDVLARPELYQPLYRYLYTAVNRCFAGTALPINLRGYMLHVSLRLLALLPLCEAELDGKEAELFCSLFHWSTKHSSSAQVLDADGTTALLETLEYAFTQFDISFGSLMLQSSGALLMNLLRNATTGSDTVNLITRLHKFIPKLLGGMKTWTDRYVEEVRREAGLSEAAVKVMLAGLPHDVGTEEFVAVTGLAGLQGEEFAWLINSLRILHSEYVYFCDNKIKFVALWKDSEAESNIQEEASLLHVVFLEQAMAETVLVKGKTASVAVKRVRLGLRVLVELLGRIVRTGTAMSNGTKKSIIQALPTLRGGKFCEFLRGPILTQLVEDLGMLSTYETNSILEERQREAILQCWRERESLGVKTIGTVLECLLDKYSTRPLVSRALPLSDLLGMLEYSEIDSNVVFRCLSHILVNSLVFPQHEVETFRSALPNLIDMLFQDLHNGGDQCLRLFEVVVKKDPLLRSEILDALLKQPPSMYASVRSTEELERMLSLFLYAADLGKTVTLVCGALQVLLKTAPVVDKEDTSALLKVWIRFVSQVLHSFAEECVQVPALPNVPRDRLETKNLRPNKDIGADVTTEIEPFISFNRAIGFDRPQILASDLSDDDDELASGEEVKNTQADTQEEAPEEQEKEAVSKQRQDGSRGAPRASRTSSMSSENTENSQFEDETNATDDVGDKGEDQTVVPKCDSIFGTSLSQDQDDQDGDQDADGGQSQGQSQQSQSQTQEQSQGRSKGSQNKVGRQSSGQVEGVDGAEKGEASPLDKQLCTYTVTGTSFREQHWYHCVTCNLMKEKGCCSVCVRVCHDGHLVTYARRSRFFCDCGADDVTNPCHAKVARVFPEIMNRVVNPPSFPESISLEAKQRAGASTEAVPASTKLGSLLLNKAVLEAISRSPLLGLLERSLEWLNGAAKEVGDTAVDDMEVEGSPGKTAATGEALLNEGKLFVLTRATARGCAGGFMDYDHSERVGSLMATDSRGHVVVVEGREVKVLEAGALLCDSAVSPGGEEYDVTMNRVPSVAVACLSKKTTTFVPQHVVFNPMNDLFLAACGKQEVCLLKLDDNGSICSSTRVEISHDKTECVKHSFWVPQSQTVMIFVARSWVKLYDFSVDVISPVQYIPIQTDVHVSAAAMLDSSLFLLTSSGQIVYRSFDLKRDGAMEDQSNVDLFPLDLPPGLAVKDIHVIGEQRKLVVIDESGQTILGSVSIDASTGSVQVDSWTELELTEKAGAMAQWVNLVDGVVVGVAASRTSILAIRGEKTQRLVNSSEGKAMTTKDSQAVVEMTSKYGDSPASVVVGAAMWPPGFALKKMGYDSGNRDGPLLFEPCLLVLCNNGMMYRYCLRHLHNDMLAYRDGLLSTVEERSVVQQRKARMSYENPFPRTCNSAPPAFIFEKLVLVEDDNGSNCGCSFSGDILDYCNAQRALELLKGPSSKLVKGLRKYRSGFWLSVQCARPNLAITAVRLKIGKISGSLRAANVILVGPFRRRVVLGNVSERWHDLTLTPREALYAASEGGLNVYLTSDDDHFVVPEIELFQIFVLPVHSRNWERYIHSWREASAAKSTQQQQPASTAIEKQMTLFDQCSTDIVDLLLNVYRGLNASGHELHAGKLVGVAEQFESTDTGEALNQQWQYLLRVVLGDEAYDRHCTWARLRRIIKFASNDNLDLDLDQVCELSALGKAVVNNLDAKEWEGAVMLRKCVAHVKRLANLGSVERRSTLKQAIRNTADWALRAAYSIFATADKDDKVWRTPLHDLLALFDGSSLVVINVSIESIVESVEDVEKGKQEGSFGQDKAVKVQGASASEEGKSKKEKTIAYRCDGCRRYPLKKERYHCTVCEDFDLCSACFEDANPALHSPTHLMERIEILQPSKTAVSSSIPAESSSLSGMRAFCVQALQAFMDKAERTEFTSVETLASLLKLQLRLSTDSSLSTVTKAGIAGHFLPSLYRLLGERLSSQAGQGFEEEKKRARFCSKDMLASPVQTQCLLVLLKAMRFVVGLTGKKHPGKLMLGEELERIVPSLFQLIRVCAEIPKEYYESHIILKDKDAGKHPIRAQGSALGEQAQAQSQGQSPAVGQSESPSHSQPQSQPQAGQWPGQADTGSSGLVDGTAVLEPLVLGKDADGDVEEFHELWKTFFKQSQLLSVKGDASVLFCEGRIPVLLLHSAVLLCAQLSTVYAPWFKKNLGESSAKRMLLQMIDMTHLRFLRTKAKAILLNLSASFDEYKFSRNESVLCAELDKIERLVETRCDKYQMRAKLLCSLDKVVKIARLFSIKMTGNSVGKLVFKDILGLPMLARENKIIVKALQLYLLNLSKQKVKGKLTSDAEWLDYSLTLCKHREEEVRTAAAAIVQQHWSLLKEEKAKVKLFTQVAQHLAEFNQETLLLLVGFLSSWTSKGKAVPKLLQSHVPVLMETLNKLVHAENNHEYVMVNRQLAALSHLQIHQEESEADPELLLPPGSSLVDGSICPTCVAPVTVSKTLLLERVKAEARWTGNTMMVQLDSSYTFEALHIEMTPLVAVNGKDVLSVREVVVYCNNEPTTELSSLKGNWRMWDRIAAVKLVPRRTKMLYRLSLPVTACNLLFEYVGSSDLNATATAERLICPRCESVVSDRHGICHNCGEVAFQCRLCRTINYENLNALLCVECGYCRFARFVYGIQGNRAHSWPPIRDEQAYNLAITRLKSVSAKASSLNLLLTSTRLSGKTYALKLWTDYTAATSLPVEYSQKKGAQDPPKYSPTVKLVDTEPPGPASSTPSTGTSSAGTGANEKKTSSVSSQAQSLSSLARSSLVANARAGVRVMNLRKLQEYTTAVQQGTPKKKPSSHGGSSEATGQAQLGAASASTGKGASNASLKKQGLIAQLRKTNRLRELKRLERSSFYRKEVVKLADYDRYQNASRSTPSLADMGRRSRRSRGKARGSEHGKTSSRARRSMTKAERTGSLSVVRRDLKSLEKVYRGSRAHTYDQLRLVVEEMASIRTALKVYEEHGAKATEGGVVNASDVSLIPAQDFDQTCLHCGEACSLLYHELIRLLAKSHGSVCETLVKHGVVDVLWESGVTAHGTQLDSVGEALVAVVSRNSTALAAFQERLLKAVSVVLDTPTTLYRANWLAGPMQVFSRVADTANTSVLSSCAETAISVLQQILPNPDLNCRPELIHAAVLPCSAVLIGAHMSNKKLALGGKMTLERYIERKLLNSWRDFSAEGTVAKWRTRAEIEAGGILAAHFAAWKAVVPRRRGKAKGRMKRKKVEAEKAKKPLDWFTVGLLHPTSSEVRQAFEELLPEVLQDGGGKTTAKVKGAQSRARQDLDVLDGLAKVYLHVVNGDASNTKLNDFVVTHMHKLFSMTLSKHGPFYLYFLAGRGFVDALCQTLLAQAGRLCEDEFLSVRHPAVISPRLESLTSLAQTLNVFMKVNNLAFIMAKQEQQTLLKAYAMLESIALFQNPRLETSVKLLHDACKHVRLTVTKMGKDKEKEKTKERLKKGCNDEFLTAACALLEQVVGDLVDLEGEETEAKLKAVLRRATVVLDEMIAGLSPEQKRSPIRVFLQRAPTQEDYFRGNIPKNPLSTDEIPIQDVENNATSEPTMGDLRAKIGADLDLENATDVMELLVAEKIISTSLSIRLVYEKLWKPNSSGMGAGDNGSVSQDSQSDVCMEDDEDDHGAGANPSPVGSPKKSRIEEEEKRGMGMYDTDDGEQDQDDEGVGTGGMYGDMDEEVYSDEQASMGGGNPMVVTYRLCGLDGEATEDYVEHLEDNKNVNKEEEERKLSQQSQVLRDTGFSCLLKLVKFITHGCDVRSKDVRKLLGSIFALLDISCQIKSNRLCLLSLGYVPVLLDSLVTAMKHADASSQAERLLSIFELLLNQANDTEHTDSKLSAETAMSDAQVTAQLEFVIQQLDNHQEIALLRSNPMMFKSLAKLLPFLTYGKSSSIDILAKYCKDEVGTDALKRYDSNADDDPEKAQDMSTKLQCVLNAFQGIGRDVSSMKIRTELLKHDLARDIIEYMEQRIDECQQDWRAVAAKPSTRIVLQVLTGLVRGHPETQALVLDSSLLRAAFEMEKMPSSDIKDVGDLADQFLVAAEDGNAPIQARMKSMKEDNRKKKLKQAMAKRQKLMRKMGLSASKKRKKQRQEGSAKGKKQKKQKGKSKLTPKIGDGFNWKEEMKSLKDEQGVVCTVCQEGYTYKPTEPIGVYIYSKLLPAKENPTVLQPPLPRSSKSLNIELNKSARKEDVEAITRVVRGANQGIKASPKHPQLMAPAPPFNNYACSSVTCFTCVHFSCHHVAARADANQKNPKEEWDGAQLRNGQTKCNNLIPLRGPSSISEEMFKAVADGFLQSQLVELSSASSAYNKRNRDLFLLMVHDIKFLLLRFAFQESLSEDTNGGGRVSNFMLLVPMLALGAYLRKRDIAEAKLKPNGFSLTMNDLMKALVELYENEEPLNSVVDAFPLHIVTTLFAMSFDRWQAAKQTFFRASLRYAQRVHQNVAANGESAHGSGALTSKRGSGQASAGPGAVSGSNSATATGTNEGNSKALTSSDLLKKYKHACLLFGIVNELHKLFEKRHSGEGGGLESWLSNETEALSDCEGLASRFQGEFEAVTELAAFLPLLDLKDIEEDVFV